MKPLGKINKLVCRTVIGALLLSVTALFSTTPAAAQSAESIVPDSIMELIYINRNDDALRAESFAKVIDYLFNVRCYQQAQPYIDEFMESDFVQQDKYYSALGDYYRGTVLLFDDPKESFRLLKKAEQEYLLLKKSKESETLGARIYFALGAHYYENSKKHAESYECLQKAGNINKELKDVKIGYMVEMNKGLMDIVSEEYEDAVGIYRGILSNPQYSNMNKVNALFNMGFAFKNLMELDSARVYFEASCRASVSKQDSIRAMGELVALPFLAGNCEEAVADIETVLETIKQEGDVKTVGYVMGILGEVLHCTGRLKEAVAVLNDCLELCGEETTYDWIKVEVLKELKGVMVDLGDYRACYEVQQQLDSVNRRLEADEQARLLQRLQLEQEYNEIEAQMNYERDMERMREKRKNAVTFFIIAILLLAVTLVLVLLGRKSIVLKAKTEEKEQLSSELERKKQELVSKLLSQTKTNDALNEIKEQLVSMEKLQEEDRSNAIGKAVKKLDGVINANTDENFDYYFLQVHPGFYEGLRKDFPDLTLSELRLCALIRLNMNIKDIASINNITINGVKVARWRLRKKLGMNDANDNLSVFLSKY